METILLKPFHHRGMECIGIYFTHGKEIFAIVKRLAPVKWSRTYNCWYIPCSREHYSLLVRALENKAVIETGLLKTYLQQRKALVPVLPKKIAAATTAILLQFPLNEANLAAITKLRARLFC